MPVPSASERGRLRWGFLTSPAVKVTLFQASIEKSAPTMATPIRVIVLMVHVGESGGYGCITHKPALRQKSVKLTVRAASVENQKPRRTSIASAPVFATVKIF